MFIPIGIHHNIRIDMFEVNVSLRLSIIGFMSLMMSSLVTVINIDNCLVRTMSVRRISFIVCGILIVLLVIC